MIFQKLDPPPDCVLIVDQLEDSREVLQTALQRRGLRTLVTDSVEDGLQLAQSHRPQVIVLDVESQAADDDAMCRQFASHAQQQNQSLVVLGAARAAISPHSRRRFVRKPYHYAPLIRTIEQLLEQ